MSAAPRTPSARFVDVDSDCEGEPIDIDTRPNVPVADVMAVALRARTRELPGNYPFAVKAHYIDEFLKKWTAPSNRCFDDSAEIYDSFLKQLLRKHFGKFAHGGLLDEVGDALQVHFDRVRAEARAKLAIQLEVETGLIQTQNDHYFFDYKAKMLLRYKDARRTTQFSHMFSKLSIFDRDSWAHGEDFRNRVHGILSGLRGIGISVGALDLAKLLPADSMDTALDVMAEVRAYFQVAYKRVTDVVPKTIERELITAVDAGMTPALLRGLDFMGPGMQERCIAWVQEPRALAQERADLRAKIKTLAAARVLLARHG